MKAKLISAAGILSAVLWAEAASAQDTVEGTPYVRFDTDLADTPQGSYQNLPSPQIALQGQGASGLFGAEANITIPFDFQYYDDAVNTFVAGSHGVLGTNGPAQFSTFNWAPGTRSQFSPNGFIAGAWGSHYMLAGTTGSYVGAQLFGTAPSRVVAIEFANFAESSSANFGCCEKLLSWTIRLFEGLSGRIEIDFKGEDLGADGGFLSGTSGMEDNNGVRPIEFMPGNPNITHSQWINALDGKRITLVQDPGIEVVALRVSTPEFANLGAPVDLPITLANLNGAFTPDIRVAVQASEDRNFENPSEVTEIGDTSFLVAPYTTLQSSIQVRFPQSLGTRRYFTRLVVDTEDALNEVDETNNTVVSESPVRLLPSRPDLVVDDVSTEVFEAEPGEEVALDLSISNIGSDTTSNVEVAIILSTNPAISPQDSELARTNPLTLDPGQTITLDDIRVSLPMELNSGSYFLGAFVDIDGDFEESNEANNGRAADDPLTVAGGDVAIITPRIPAALAGEPYSALMTAVGGDGDYTWQLENQAPGTGGNSPCPNPRLPQGICLDAGTGRFFGNCTEQGEFDIVVEAASDGFASGTRQYTFRCIDPEEPLTIVTRNVPDGIVGKEYNFEVVVTGGNSADRDALNFSATGLPMGLELREDGIIAGTPMQATPEEGAMVMVSVGDGNDTDDQQLRLVVNDNQNLLIEVAELPMAELDQAYTAQILASGGVGEINFSVDSGSLPPGLVLTPRGEITGIPDEVGSFSFVVRASDSPPPGNLRAQDRNEFVINVVDNSGEFRIVTDSLPVGFEGQGYNAVVTAVGGVPELTWELDRNTQLPPGLEALQTQVSQEFTIVGTPEEGSATNTNLLVTVTDNLDRQIARVLVLSIVDPEDLPPEDCLNDPTDFRCEGVDLNPDEGCTHSRLDGALAPVALLGLVLMAAFVRRRRDA